MRRQDPTVPARIDAPLVKLSGGRARLIGFGAAESPPVATRGPNGHHYNLRLPGEDIKELFCGILGVFLQKLMVCLMVVWLLM